MVIGLVDVALLGLSMGVKHALEPDHLAAITSLVTRHPGAEAAAKTGALWGFGHALAIGLLGSILIVLNARIPDKIAILLEFCVVAMLCILGIRSFVFAKRGSASIESKQNLKPGLFVGFIHGISGTGALTLYCLSTIQSRGPALLLLLLFSVSSLFSMSVMSGLLATPISWAAKKGERTVRFLLIGGGIVALVAAVIVAKTLINALLSGGAPETING